MRIIDKISIKYFKSNKKCNKTIKERLTEKLKSHIITHTSRKNMHKVGEGPTGTKNEILWSESLLRIRGCFRKRSMYAYITFIPSDGIFLCPVPDC